VAKLEKKDIQAVLVVLDQQVLWDCVVPMELVPLAQQEPVEELGPLAQLDSQEALVHRANRVLPGVRVVTWAAEEAQATLAVQEHRVLRVAQVDQQVKKVILVV
jgi:hypothetical protein